MLSALLGLIGLVSISASGDPSSTISLVAVILMGFEQIGTIVVSLALVTRDKVDEKIRGAVAGAYSFSGALGILIVGRLGGAFFDSWSPTAPFYLLAIAHGILLVVSLGTIYLRRSRSKQQVDSLAE